MPFNFPNDLLNDPSFHDAPLAARAQRLSSKSPEFKAYPPERQQKILQNAERVYRSRQQGRPPSLPEGLVEGAVKDVRLGWRSGEADLARSVSSATSVIPGLRGVSEGAEQFARGVEPTPQEEQGRTGVFSQVMQGLGSAPATMAKYLPAEVAGKYAPLVAGGIGVVSHLKEGPGKAIKEGGKGCCYVLRDGASS